jgi:hypothetical protein
MCTFTRMAGTPHLRSSRLRFRFAKENRELWLLQLKVFIKGEDGWQLASWHGTQLRNGPITDASKLQHLAGEYVSESGERLLLSWHGGGVLATWPGIDGGYVTQIFPISETDYEDGIKSLRFTFDAARQPTAVAYLRDGKEVWRGNRRK